MEEVLINIAKDTPVLAVLGILLIVVFRLQSYRDKKQSEERIMIITQFTQTANKLSEVNEKSSMALFGLLEEVKQNGIDLKTFMRTVDETHTSQSQAHQYQQKEHDQMIKVLEKINGR